ncbi:ABC transporter ATP-binding protein [Bryobacter aggregatus]|uniref:ABC transporter ATP-binding protein n=1 Tax=Bryobacter aggregatus TaxID=360054 RepID=UPI0004E0CE37|nr:ABC transporter ATP-binding protein [Bryobacter aggregatus]
MLEAIALTKRYRGITALDSASFRILPGQILGYLGPNGSGKSTTVKILTGLIDPSSGTLHLDGKPVLGNWQDYKSRLGYVPEEPYLYAHLTGKEYLELCGRLRGIEEGLLAEKSSRLLRLLEMWEARDGLLSSYSKGMRQRILILAAMLHDPDLLILDEPFSGLDINTALLFRRLMQALAWSGKMIFFSTHVFEVVEKLCTDVIILYQGQIVAHDKVERLREIAQQGSLEDVFRQLTRQPDLDAVAREAIEVMSLR